MPIPHSWTDLLRFGLTSILASGFWGMLLLFALKSLLKRKKPPLVLAEVHESEARAAKGYAEARSIDIQSSIQAGDAVLRMVQQLTFANIANDELHKENERLTGENEVYESQLRKAKALLKVHGIRFDGEADRQAVLRK
jgi:hypothetical protein